MADSPVRPRSGLAVILVVLAVFCNLFPAEAATREVVVVQSSDIRPFRDAIEGFEETCGCVIKDIITLSPDSPDVAMQAINLRPDGLLALGQEALARLQSIRSVPVFYTVVSSPPQSLHSANNISGVNMLVSPERQAEAILQILPNARRIGLVYDPAHTGAFVDKLLRGLRAQSVTVIAKKVSSSAEAPRMLEEMKGKVDALLLLPDVTVTTPEMVSLMLLFSFRNSVPVIAFSEKYVRMGALAAITVSPRDLGAQTGELAKAQLNDRSGSGKVVTYARKNIVIINMKIANKMGIKIRDSVLRKSIRVE
jgi:putative tryptophan/tyrosine transport system substrate-binding protein